MKLEERLCSTEQGRQAAKILQQMVGEEITFAEAQRRMKEATSPGNRNISAKMLRDARAHERRNTLPDDE